MMSLLFRDRAGLVDEIQRGLKIRERISFHQMVFVDHLPAGELRFQFFERFPFQRRNAAPAGNTMFFRKAHRLAPRPDWSIVRLSNILCQSSSVSNTTRAIILI